MRSDFKSRPLDRPQTFLKSLRFQQEKHFSTAIYQILRGLPAGAHTIGKVRCLFILNRLYDFPGSSDGVDPTFNSTYAAVLKKVCKPGDFTTRVPFDPSLGGNRFDSSYYTNFKQGRGVIRSDAVLSPNTALRLYGFFFFVESAIDVFNNLNRFIFQPIRNKIYYMPQSTLR